MVKLAKHLSAGDNPGSTLYFHGDHDINQVDQQVPSRLVHRTFVNRSLAAPELSVGKVVEQIESCNAWMQMRNVGADPTYGALIADLIDEFRPLAEPLAPKMCGVRGDIFVSSPGATTPFHMDEEHNFLLQIRGCKTMAIADGANRDIVSDEQLVDFFAGRSELIAYQSHFEEHAIHETIGPGDGLHIPPCHPHWVQNGDNVSISLGLLWHSDFTADQRGLYQMNTLLRNARMRPRPVGQVAWIDRTKLAPIRARRYLARAVRRTLGRAEIDV